MSRFEFRIFFLINKNKNDLFRAEQNTSIRIDRIITALRHWLERKYAGKVRALEESIENTYENVKEEDARIRCVTHLSMASHESDWNRFKAHPSDSLVFAFSFSSSPFGSGSLEIRTANPSIQ